MSNENFKRIEKKFWLTKNQYDTLYSLIKEHLEEDEHSESKIANIYFDTDNYSMIRTSIERPIFKEKLRFRSYDSFKTSSPVFIELKRKYNGIGYKRRAQMSYQDAWKLYNFEQEPQNQIEKEIKEFLERYEVSPKVYLTYNRNAYYLKEDPEFRITFDSNLRFKRYDENIVFDEAGEFIMDDHEAVLLEVKTSKALPLWFNEIMTRLQVYQAPYSKIGAVYTKHLKGEQTYA